MTREEELQKTIDELRAELNDLRERVAPVLELERLSPHRFHWHMVHAWKKVDEIEEERRENEAKKT